MNTRIVFLSISLIFILSDVVAQQGLEPVPLDDAWKKSTFSLAPDKPMTPVKKPRRVLLFSLYTGYQHWVIPHADEVISILGSKSGAYEVERSVDIQMFQKKNLRRFDAVVLNNNCSVGDRRNLFYDALAKDSTKTQEECMALAAEMEANLLNFVKRGGGLAALHGGIVMQNNSPEFSDMLGGSFDYHPPQQMIEVMIAETEHPLLSHFQGKSFSHVDEPYFFKNAYLKKQFRPMLYMEVAKINGLKHSGEDKYSYVSWIKKYGKGRVFYVSPSHNAQSYENASLLQFYLNGMQYVLGDLRCDDTPKAL
ncbi:MAG: ThuA domain-containing protein [Cyclobacteriaceae bacterium]|nr:ThuA domain-containing protein [Cyclobacteriaceae bacterium]